MSERTLTASVQTALEQSLLRLAVFVELVLDGGNVRLWSGLGPYTLGGNVYTGAGSLGGIDEIEEESGDVRASGIALSLSGITTEAIALVLNEQFQGRKATVWLGFFDGDWVLIPDAVKLFSGRLDYPLIDESAENCRITIFAENHLADLERPRVRRYTHEDQMQLYPGDLGLEFVAAIQNKEIIWKAPG